jgi:HPt (histidine-containing phosphotransfer) domain-containing protein
LDAARRLTHRLKGTSGSYELLEVSACLQRIEDRIEELVEAPADPAALWGEIDAELERAVAAIEPVGDSS